MNRQKSRQLFEVLDALELTEYFHVFQSAGLSLEELRGLDDDSIEALGVSEEVDRVALLAELHRADATERQGYRLITVVMVDMVSSTQMTLREGPEAMRRRVNRFRAVVEEETRRFDGLVSQHIGDGSVLHFGWPVSQEGDAERAATAALAIRDRVVADRNREKEPTRLRIGLATGTVLARDLADSSLSTAGADVIGLAAHLADRLQAMAADGEVLACGRTADLVRSEIRLGLIRRLELRGFAEPVEARTLLGRAKAATRFEARSAGGPRRPLFGREVEQARLQEMLSDVLAGHGGAVLITGPAGIGKSRLSQAIEEVARDRGMIVRKLQCSALFKDTAFHPFARLAEREVSPGANGESGERARRLMDSLAPPGATELRVLTVARFFELPGVDLSPLQTVAAELYVAELEIMFAEFVVTIKDKRPVLLLFEDLHWADERSLRLVANIVGQLRERPSMLLVTSRTPPPAFASLNCLLELPLSPLKPEFAAKMVREALAEHGLDANLAPQLAEVAAGNPLFVEELARSLAERAGAADRPGLAVPVSLKTGFMERLDRLGSAKAMAQQASCFGGAFAPELLERLLDQPKEELRSGLDLLCEREILRPQTEDPQLLEFSHALLREEAYASITDEWRSKIHGRLAELTEEDGAAPEVVAHHAALAGRQALAAARWAQAGEVAAGRLSYSGALAHWQRSLAAHATASAEGVGNPVAELTAMLRASDCIASLEGWSSTAFYDASLQAEAAADRLGDLDALAAARAALSLSCFDKGRLEDARRHAATIAEIGDSGALGPFLAEATLVHPCYFSCDYEGALRHARSAIGKFESISNPSGGAAYFYCLCRLSEGWSLWSLGHEAEAVAALDATLALYPVEREPFLRAYALVFDAILAFFRRDGKRQLAAADEGAALSEAYGFKWFQGILLIFRAEALLQDGETDAATAEIERGMALAYQPETRSGLPTILDIISRFRFVAGDRDGALTAIAEARKVAADTGQSYWNPELMRREAAILAAAGETDRGAELAAAAVEAAAATGSVALKLRAQHTLNGLSKVSDAMLASRL